uniref:Integrin alpha-PS1 n=1 Tax=Ceratitis capitata TaxID=7213 RepID=W8BIS2_CERCA
MSSYYIKQPPIASNHLALPQSHNKSVKIADITATQQRNTTVMSLLLLIFCFCISNIPQSCAFNLENRLPIVKYGPHANSYFGYSIATHIVGEVNLPTNRKW